MYLIGPWTFFERGRNEFLPTESGLPRGSQATTTTTLKIIKQAKTSDWRFKDGRNGVRGQSHYRFGHTWPMGPVKLMGPMSLMVPLGLMGPMGSMADGERAIVELRAGGLAGRRERLQILGWAGWRPSLEAFSNGCNV